MNEPILKISSILTISSSGSRPIQEDYVLNREDKGIFTIADGFGGSSFGARAAEQACQGVIDFLEKEAGDLDATLPFVLRSYYTLAGNVLFNALIHANQKLNRLNVKDSANERGGASVLAGYLDGELLALASAGNCSAHLLRGGERRALITPKTFGRMNDPFAQATGELSNVPLAALGMSEDLEPEVSEFKVRSTDWLVLHTDGLDPEMMDRLEAVQAGAWMDTERALKQLRECLSRHRGDDNLAVTVVLF